MADNDALLTPVERDMLLCAIARAVADDDGTAKGALALLVRKVVPQHVQAMWAATARTVAPE